MTDYGAASLHDLVRAFSTPQPLPAGGAAGVVALALGAAVGAKALRISGHTEAATALSAQAARALPFYQADCEAFAQILTTSRATRPSTKKPQPSAESAKHAATQQAAWHKATAIPVGIAHLATQMRATLAPHHSAIKPSVQADYTAAQTLIQVAHQIATQNAHDNATHLDPQTATKLLKDTPQNGAGGGT